MTALSDNKRAFISLALEMGVLRFGDFTLKSGRSSPYFFNAGLFDNGEALAALGRFYAQTLIDEGVSVELLFGPAYKGIPLVCSTVMAYAELTGLSLPFAYNRKEIKDHGEGGQLVGAEVKGKTVIVDDVITAGTAIREVMSLLADTRADVTAVLVAIDRQEKGAGDLSAIQEVEQEYGVSVFSIVKLNDIIEFMQTSPDHQEALDSIVEYRRTYGIA